MFFSLLCLYCRTSEFYCSASLSLLKDKKQISEFSRPGVGGRICCNFLEQGLQCMYTVRLKRVCLGAKCEVLRT